MKKLITFFIEFKTLKKIFLNNLEQLTIKRELGKVLMKKRYVIDLKPNPELLERYKKYIEGEKLH